MNKFLKILSIVVTLIYLLFVSYNIFLQYQNGNNYHPEQAGLKAGAVFLVSLIIRTAVIIHIIILFGFYFYKKNKFPLYNIIFLIVILLLSFLF